MAKNVDITGCLAGKWEASYAVNTFTCFCIVSKCWK